MSPYSITSGTLIVALDIGKNVHWFGCYHYDGPLVELVPPQKVRSDTVGLGTSPPRWIRYWPLGASRPGCSATSTPASIMNRGPG